MAWAHTFLVEEENWEEKCQDEASKMDGFCEELQEAVISPMIMRALRKKLGDASFLTKLAVYTSGMAPLVQEWQKVNMRVQKMAQVGHENVSDNTGSSSKKGHGGGKAKTKAKAKAK